MEHVTRAPRLASVTFLALAICDIVRAQGLDFNSRPPSFDEKWQFFVRETSSPLTLASGAFNGTVSQLTHSDPLYGSGWGPWSQRFGASTADIATQNLFGDFLFAAAFREDTRYRRDGPGHRFWARVGYAAGTGISNLYYPPASRNGHALVVHFATSVVGAGLGNLAPEFWSAVPQPPING